MTIKEELELIVAILWAVVCVAMVAIMCAIPVAFCTVVAWMVLRCIS